MIQKKRKWRNWPTKIHGIDFNPRPKEAGALPQSAVGLVNVAFLYRHSSVYEDCEKSWLETITPVELLNRFCRSPLHWSWSMASL